MLNKFGELFDGSLGCYPHKKMHLELLPDAKSVHSKPYAVPRAHEEVFKNELDHLCTLGVLERCVASEWGAPIIPKKDRRVRWVSDFRALNKLIERKIYPLPRIQDILSKRKGYQFFTKLDLSMKYYTFELDEESSDLCTVVTPFGKYRYLQVPMGIKLPPGSNGNKAKPQFAQGIMEDIFRDMDETAVFLDDIETFSDDFDDHLASLERVLK
jgi:hypothetical protein